MEREKVITWLRLVKENNLKIEIAADEILALFGVVDSEAECCEELKGFYLGTTCPKCNRPFRSVKKD